MHAPKLRPPLRVPGGSGPILIAVSGGSDSVGLLFWLSEKLADRDLHVVTVDHNLRSEAGREAANVAQMSKRLALPHTTLTWCRHSPATAKTAREARYALMHELAMKIGAQSIALGHTLDDQAETVVMRALRTDQYSDTRGLSGMSEFSTYHGVSLWRPLLGVRRQELREMLLARDIVWVEDPTNFDEGYERVRVRNTLAAASGVFPSVTNIARLASLSGRTRRWLSQQVALHLKAHARLRADGAFLLEHYNNTPLPVLREAISVLILAAGGLAFRASGSKLRPILQNVQTGETSRHTLGRCLIQTQPGRITIERERRNLPPVPECRTGTADYDGRYLLRPASGTTSAELITYIQSLEIFRSENDDPVYAALMDLLRP